MVLTKMVPYTSDQQQIWVFGDLRDSHLFSLSLNAMAKMRTPANDLNCELVMLFFEGKGGSNSQSNPTFNCLSVENSVDSAIGHGADYILCFENSEFAPPQTHILSAGLAEAIRQYQPLLCIFALTDFGREMAAKTAAIGKMGLLSDCLKLSIEDGLVIGYSPAWEGSILARIAFTDNRKTGLATVHPYGQCEPLQKGRPGELVRNSLQLRRPYHKLRLVNRMPESNHRRQLEEAEIVVVGGMGLASSHGFEKLKEVADILGGEIAATRPAVLKGWLEEDRMIGQTGKSIKPKLLITVGTSGAIQYTAGIQGAEFILAVNSDPEAPIFKVADVGIVADASIFIGLLVEKIHLQLLRRHSEDLRLNSEHCPPYASKGIGKKLHELRTERQYRYEDIAEATGRSVEFIQRVEKNHLIPPVNFLLKLASSFNLSPDTFLQEQIINFLKKERSASYHLRSRHDSYHFLTESNANDHLHAFNLTIPPQLIHKPVAYKHEGEEFVWVKEGIVELKLNGENFILNSGDFKHFDSSQPHKLRNLSDQPAQCLIVLYAK